MHVSSKIGEDQSAEDAEDGPPELLVSGCFILVLTVNILLIGVHSVQQYKLCWVILCGFLHIL